MDTHGAGWRVVPLPAVIHQGGSVVCALYSIVEEVGVARTVEERVLFVKQSGFAEVTCFKGQVTERTKKWVFAIF